MSSAKKPRVVCLGNPKFIKEDDLARFKESFDFSVLEAYTYKETHEKLPEEIKKNGPIDAFMIRMGTHPYEPFDEAMFEMMLPACRIVVSASAGYNEFPVEWLANRGVYFCNTIDAVAEATADMALYLILAVLRNTTNAERSARSGSWRHPQGLVPARDPSGLTLGIVGMGNVGSYLARKAAVFNMEVLYYNRKQRPLTVEKKFRVRYCSTLEELLSSSDVVSINVPLNANTTNLIGRAEFNAMKDGSFLVNTARGAVIDESSLKQALQSGKVARAGLDVFCNEPEIDKWFLESDKVVIQPHLGGLTDVAYQRAETECLENIKSFFTTGVPRSPVLPVNLERQV